ncbi:MAG: hypothetical protein ACI87E_004397 [Mariniblastus sp.]|jgi:hypothetical protein
MKIATILTTALSEGEAHSGLADYCSLPIEPSSSENGYRRPHSNTPNSPENREYWPDWCLRLEAFHLVSRWFPKSSVPPKVSKNPIY